MESFFRYIAYIDYYEKGLRLSNAGYLRWKMTGSRHQLEIEIKEAKAGTGYYRITEAETGKELAVLQLIDGQGSLKESYSSREKEGSLVLLLEGEELDLYKVKALRIELERDRILRIPLELPLPERKEGRSDSGGSLISQLIREEKAERIEEKRPEKPKRKQKEKTEENREGKNEGRKEMKEEGMTGDRLPIISIQKEERKEREAVREAEEKIYPPLEEDKWQQLCKSYPQVHPFPGGKTFLSIKPEDFVLLQESYQKLVHNSFLLHGYYNYRHMILGKLEEGEEQPYYIGVPGVFYEKEKQAAGLFGFAGFEGTEYPVRNGSQGYYMIEVKL